MSAKKFSSHQKQVAKHSGSLKNNQAKKSASKKRQDDFDAWHKKGKKTAFAYDQQMLDKKYRTHKTDKTKRPTDDAWHKPQAWQGNKKATAKKQDFPYRPHNVVDDFVDNKPYKTHKKNAVSGSLKKSFNEEYSLPQNHRSGSLKNEKVRFNNKQIALTETDFAFKAKKSAKKAKKMTLRRPNKEILHKSEKLREIRSEIDKPVRLQKALSSAGLGSRRHCEELIAAGVVKINGKVAQLGDKVLPADEITVKDKAVKPVWQDRLPRIVLYYKQEGEIVSRNDPQGRLSVFDRLPQVSGSLWVAIGRLDINTAGLLIFTTSGELANRFAHPSYAIDREYRVRVNGELTEQQIKQLTTDGIPLEDGIAKAARLIEYDNEGKNRRYDIVVQEGRNREVRRIFEHFGLTVTKLTRIRFGVIGIPPRLKRGQFYELNEVETAFVLKEMGMEMPKMKRKRK